MNNTDKVCKAIAEADALLIGASNGLSIAEGYHIFANNAMFHHQFGDFQERYGVRSVIDGCFFRYPDENTRQEFFRRLVQYWVKDYRPSQVMKDLLAIVEGKDYFILTTNADTHLELSGFDPVLLFCKGACSNWKALLNKHLLENPLKTRTGRCRISLHNVTAVALFCWNWALGETTV